MGASKQILRDMLEYSALVLDGLLNTLTLAASITISGLLVGLFLLFFLINKNRHIKNVAETYVSFFKGTPLIPLLFLIYYGSPALGWRISAFEAALVGFTLNIAAYNSSYLFSSYLSIDQSELESAEAMGFSKTQIYLHIILPQVLATSIPTLTSQAISNLKDTALVFLIGYTDFFARMQEIATENFQFLWVYTLVAMCYLLLTSMIILLSRELERRLINWNFVR
ncbi:amino acid ABC transporter permease [Burkholderia ubonensis]|uniref:Amino acid ABC transporter permease n=1 Tax=Burkholderia ubonensis TaxID=101571 RepID=A0A106Q2G8_9BURK|nr:amino acid ABC transporter permease [Burkholderia ubonensis]KWA78768.1 amino acid ABC transporter permease [Burkholderia ubonensis]KWZ58441.1 amino acid ABC transporter permease [Burkholderia ubonensis]